MLGGRLSDQKKSCRPVQLAMPRASVWGPASQPASTTAGEDHAKPEIPVLYRNAPSQEQKPSQQQPSPAQMQEMYAAFNACKPGGWFKEKVSEWRPHEALAFELYECSLPVRRLKHRYTIVADGAGTVVRQRMEYELKFGAFGRLLDALFVKRKWNAGIRSFFGGLKRYIEDGDAKVR
jgi:hypothetical protein